MKSKVVIAVMVISPLCLAQETPKADLFLGYSFLRANAARDIPAFTANGGAGSLGFNFNDHVGLEAEFGGYHNGNINDIQFDTTMMTYLFGPRVSVGRSKRVSPYFHALFGGMHFTTSIAAVATPLSTTSSGRLAASQDAFAMAFGGGLDLKMSKHVSLRPIQLDWLMSRLQDFGQSGTPSQNRNQHNLRYAAGLLFTFGGEKAAPEIPKATTKPCPGGRTVGIDEPCPNLKFDMSLASAQNQVCPGGVVKIAPSTTFPADATAQWTVNGEPIGGGTSLEFASAGRSPGVYKVGLRVTAPGYDEALSETAVRVLEYQPPSGALQVSPTEIWAGEKATLTANFTPGQCGGSLGPVSFTPSEGSVQGTEYDSTSVRFDPADRSEQRKTVTIAANVTDQGGPATAQGTVIVKKKAALVATRLPDIIFPARSARVNNCGKRVLLEILKSYTANDPTGKVVLVGHTAAGERAPADLDRHRALNAAAVISAGQGICTSFPAAQIAIGAVGASENGVDFQPHFCGTSTDVRTTERAGQAVNERDEDAKARRVEVWFVPTGGVMPTSTADYTDSASLSVSSLGCPK